MSDIDQARAAVQARNGYTPMPIARRLSPSFWGCLALLSLSLAAVANTNIPPVDYRLTVKASQFKKTQPRTWVTKDIESPGAFDELIYSWHLRLIEGQGFRLYLRAKAANGDASPWLPGSYSGQVRNLEKRKEPAFDWGRMAMDQLFLDRKATRFQFMIVDEGDRALIAPPALSVVTTDNHPASARKPKSAAKPSSRPSPVVILDLPFRRQADSKGNAIPDRCQSAALATAMEYFGRPVGLEDIVPWTFDAEYAFQGIWPQTLGAGIQHGFEGYIDRFRDWDQVRATVAQNKVILCSIKMPPGTDCQAPPYPQIGGHIVALNGVTDDGRVVVTDSALWKENRGYRLQWLQEDFTKVWMKTKGGVGMVICPPPGAVRRCVTNLPPFPADRRQRKH